MQQKNKIYLHATQSSDLQGEDVSRMEVNITANYKFVVILNEKSPKGKLLSAAGQIAMSLYTNATEEQQINMSSVPLKRSIL